MKLVLEGITSLDELDGDIIAKDEIKRYKKQITDLVKSYQR